MLEGITVHQDFSELKLGMGCSAGQEVAGWLWHAATMYYLVRDVAKMLIRIVLHAENALSVSRA